MLNYAISDLPGFWVSFQILHILVKLLFYNHAYFWGSCFEILIDEDEL